MLLVGLMGMLAVGATAFYGYETLLTNPDDEGASAVPQPGDGSENSETTNIDLAALVDDDEDTAGTITAGDAEGDTLTGTPNPDQINGYGGNDLIDGLEGRDDLHGDAGNDTINGAQGEDTLHGGDGADQLAGGDGSDTLFGQNDDDSLLGDDGDDSLVGGDGNDTLDGGTGADALHGGLADDSLAGGEGQDTLFGHVGNDYLNGADDDQADYLNGGTGDDTIAAGAGDMVNTGSGADSVLLDARLATDHQPLITDFSGEEDNLAIIYDDFSDPDPEITIEDDPTQENRQSILVNGTIVASLDDATDLSLSHITLIPQSTL
jgi:Ca2+-binding RTX toxin-like protein